MVVKYPWDLLSISPWDALRLFDTPTIAQVSVGGSATPVAKNNGNRWALFIGLPFSGATATGATLEPGAVANGAGGFGVNSNQPLLMTYPVYGPLVTMAWSAHASPSVTVTVIEFTMKDWTQALVPMEQSLNVQPGNTIQKEQVVSAPTVNGRLSAIDYWRKKGGLLIPRE